jgi:tetratricopeptide (TPR) repeat protein
VGAGAAAPGAAAELARSTVGYLTGNGVGNTAAQEVADRLRPVFVRAGDAAGEARCWRLEAYVEMTRCRYAAADRAAAATLEAARRGGDAVLEQRVIPAISTFAVLGPMPVPEAITRTREALARATDRRGRALVERGLGRLLALDGRIDEGRRICAATRAALLDLGWNFDAALVSIDLGPLELAAGRPDLAERELRADFAALDAMGERNYIATTAALLAEAVRAQGRGDDALELASFSADAASDDDVLTQVLWRLVRARVMAERGTADEAEALAAVALGLALDTDDLSSQGDAYLAGADVAVARGELDAARWRAQAALDRYRAKGHRPGIAVAEGCLAAIG